MSKKANKAAQVLGRRGGLATARKMTKEERKARALRGTQSRWSKRTNADLAGLQTAVLPLLRDVTSDREANR